MRRRTGKRGFLLVEIAIALAVVGVLVAAAMPVWRSMSGLERDRRDEDVLQQASTALVAHAVAHGGLPAPLAFADVVGSVAASSHHEIAVPDAPVPPGIAGALPGPRLGVPSRSSVQTAWWYDVHPALRADAAGGAFLPLTEQGGAGWAFAPLRAQFDPDLNPNLATHGYRGQLCRSLNSLVALEAAIRAHEAGSAAGFERSLVHLLLPRVWDDGMDAAFGWDAAAGHATLDGAAAALDDLAFTRSSAAAFVVARRLPPAQRRFDRQNAVYAQAGSTGLDVPLSARRTPVYPPSAARRGFRIYENPATGRRDDPSSDLRDYAGRTAAVSLLRLRQALQTAGACSRPADTCLASQVHVVFDNAVRSAPPTGISLPLRLEWVLADAAGTVLQRDAVAPGAQTSGVCLDAFDGSSAATAGARILRVHAVAPDGTGGASSATSVLRAGALVDADPSGTAHATTAGAWLPLLALGAARGGQTVVVRCAGAYAVTADGPAGQLANPAVPVPTCRAEQLPT